MSRSEEIMVAVESALDILQSNGSVQKIVRDRDYPLEGVIASALSIYQGDDEPVGDDENPWGYEDRRMEFYVDIHAKTNAGPISTTLNGLHDLVVPLLMANNQTPLGLSFTQTIEELDREAPTLDYSGKVPTAVTRCTFTVQYRRQTDDPSQ